MPLKRRTPLDDHKPQQPFSFPRVYVSRVFCEDKLSNPFPQTGFLVEAIDLETAEIEA